MYVQQPLIFSHESKHLVLKGISSPLPPNFLLSVLLAAAAVVAVATLKRHDIAVNSVHFFDLAVLLLHMRSSHGS